MYQAFAILGSDEFYSPELVADPRANEDEAILDAQRMHASHGGKRQIVVIDNSHYAAGSQASVVFSLAANA